MRRLLLVLLFAAASLSAQELPEPTGRVSDFAGVLTKDDVCHLEQELQRLKGAEMIVYLAPALPEGAVLEELTLGAVNRWGIGRKGVDDGLVLFAFMKDRKVRVEVGLGLETKITNTAAKAIIDEQIAPAFRAKEYAKGLHDAIAGARPSRTRVIPSPTEFRRHRTVTGMGCVHSLPGMWPETTSLTATTRSRRMVTLRVRLPSV
jgi:uncharacterized membrane protein YgcG